MEPLLAHPDPLPAEIALALDQAGVPRQAVASADLVEATAPDDGWSGAIVFAAEDLERALEFCQAVRSGESPLAPLLLVIDPSQVPALAACRHLFDDFCLTRAPQAELVARLEQLFWRTGLGSRPELIEHGALVLNLETYQASIDGRPLDLTYMEYELLRFLAARPGKVFTRETLLSRVWGYEYFGGARTVDVHIRRLRAKVGEEHAHLIQTVRSVGYRFGQTPGWTR